jgi:hypothetical protein
MAISPKLVSILMELAQVECASKTDADIIENVIVQIKDFIEPLERDAYKLQCLEAGGVDNWEWYSDSLRPFFKKYCPEDYEDDEDE